MTKKIKEGWETQGSASAGDVRTVRFGDVVVDETFNVRQSYDEERLDALVEAIRQVGGLLSPIIVSETPDGKLYLLNGFRRSRALTKLYGASAPEVLVPARIIHCQSDEDALLVNLASDSSQEPFRRYDLAERLTQLRIHRKMDNKLLGQRTGLGPMTVSQLITARTKLAQPIIEAWRAASSAATELPFTRLLDWARYPPEEQMIAFKKYMAVEAVDEGEDDLSPPASADDEPKPQPAILLKPRTKKELLTQLDKLREKHAAGQMSAEERGAFKYARWSLNELSQLRFEH